MPKKQPTIKKIKFATISNPAFYFLIFYVIGVSIYLTHTHQWQETIQGWLNMPRLFAKPVGAAITAAILGTFLAKLYRHYGKTHPAIYPSSTKSFRNFIISIFFPLAVLGATIPITVMCKDTQENPLLLIMQGLLSGVTTFGIVTIFTSENEYARQLFS